MVTAEGSWPCRGGWRLPGSSLVSPVPSVLVQFLPHRLPPSIRVLGAEVSTEAIGGESGRRLCTALERRLVGVQILLRKVGVRFCKPAEVSWRDEGTWLLGLQKQTSRVLSSSLGLRDPSPCAPHAPCPHPCYRSGRGGVYVHGLGGEDKTHTQFFSAAHKIIAKAKGQPLYPLSYSCLGES